MRENFYPFFIGGAHHGQLIAEAITKLTPLPKNISHVGEPPENYEAHIAKFYDPAKEAEIWYYYMAADATQEQAKEIIDSFRKNG